MGAPRSAKRLALRLGGLGRRLPLLRGRWAAPVSYEWPRLGARQNTSAQGELRDRRIAHKATNGSATIAFAVDRERFERVVKARTS